MAARRKKAPAPRLVSDSKGRTFILIPGMQKQTYAEPADFADQVDGLIVTTRDRRGVAWVPEPTGYQPDFSAYRVTRDNGHHFFYRQMTSILGPTLDAVLVEL